METFWRCGEQYRRRYVEKHIVPPGISLLVGTGLHVGSEVNFKQKIHTHRDLPIDDVVDAAVSGFEKRIHNESYELTSEESAIGARKVIAQAKDLVANMAEVFAVDVAPDYQPVAVEVTTLIELPGTHDLVTVTDLRDDQGRVTDFKSAGERSPSKKWTRPRSSRRTQLRMEWITAKIPWKSGWTRYLRTSESTARCLCHTATRRTT